MAKNTDTEKVTIGKLIIKHWWKVILVTLAIGIAVSGFDYQGKSRSFHKDPIYQKKLGDKE